MGEESEEGVRRIIMALDISESAVYSWLRHIKKYSIVHNNWKLSPLEIEEYSKNEEIYELFGDINTKWKERFGYKLFKSSKKQTPLASFKQTLRQAECDAIGIRANEDNLEIALVEVACHTDGLLYSNKINTADKIASKCIVDIFMAYLCFGLTDFEVYFVSPVVKESVMNEVPARLAEANEILKGSIFTNTTIKVIFNDDFRNEINLPLKKLISEKIISSAEDSENYLRGLMIYDI